MEPELLKRKELADLLSMGKQGATDLCHRNGVEPINVGKGKRASLRWSRSAVMAMLSTMQASGNQKPQRRPNTRRTISGKSMSVLIAELACPVQ